MIETNSFKQGNKHRKKCRQTDRRKNKMKNNILNSLRNYKFAIATFTALLLAGGGSAEAQTSYTGSASTGTWNSSRWNNSADASPYTSAWIANNAASFAAGAYTFTTAATSGVTVNVGNITLASGATVTFSGALGTFGTGGAVRSLDIGTGSLLDFGTQATSTASGTGFIMNGAGVLATAGGAYSGGFTLNTGTVIMRGVDAMGGSASNVLTLNGGTVASNATRTLANTKYGGGIVIGGNVQFGELATVNTLASSTANLSFANNVSLGSAVRTFTLGNDGVQTFSGTISNTSGGITFSANSGLSGAGRFDITGIANTFTGPININAGEVRFSADGSLGNSANTIVIDGGRLATASAASYTIASGRGIAVGDGAGTSISTTGAGTLTYNGVIANKTDEIGSWAKQGSGTLSLGGANTYTGNTTISAGILQLGNALALQYSTLDMTSSLLGDASNGLKITPTTLTLGGLAGNKDLASVFTTASGGYTGLTALTLNSGNGSSKSYSGIIANGAAGMTLTKTGAGTQALSGANTYSGTTTVDAGTLAVNGSLLTTGSVVVNANGFLGGSGRVGAISGAGTVGPGNSPGILTATSVNPNAGTDFKFEFTALNPTYSSATASENDLLRLTSNSSPFAGGTFGGGNIISIYLNSSSITTSLLNGQNTTFSGGFFVDGTYGLAAALSPASFAYYTTSAALGTGSAVDYNGISYYLLDSTIAAKTTLSDTAVTGAGFATGTVSGTLLTFNAVPEPSAQSLLTFGMVALVAVRSLRRKQS
jgi:autotransporter-associated beta strand protein